jgi:hypothetical protein
MYLVLNLVLALIVGLVPAVMLCALAGRWDLWNVWVTAGIFIAWTTFQTLAFYRRGPAMLRAACDTPPPISCSSRRQSRAKRGWGRSHP